MRISAASEPLIQGERGEQGRSLEGIHIISRKWDFSFNRRPGKMSEDKFQEVEERKIAIFVISA